MVTSMFNIVLDNSGCISGAYHFNISERSAQTRRIWRLRWGVGGKSMIYACKTPVFKALTMRGGGSTLCD